MKCEQQKISVKRREMYFYFIYALSTVCDHSAQEYLAYCLNVNTLKDYRSEPKLLAPFFPLHNNMCRSWKEESRIKPFSSAFMCYSIETWKSLPAHFFLFHYDTGFFKRDMKKYITRP